MTDIRTIQWHLGDACNLRCRHCYQDAYAATCTTALAERILAGIDALGPRRLVTLTGGEPLAHPLWQTIAAHLSAHGHRWALLTNGTLVDAPMAERIAALSPRFVQVSIDGDVERHEQMRGPGTFARAAAGIRHLVRAGVAVSISCTVHHDNWRDLPAVLRHARRWRARWVWSDRALPCGSGAGITPLSAVETKAWIDSIAREQRRWRPWSRTRMLGHRALQFLACGGVPYRCTAARTLIALLPDGTVLPCRRMPIPCGTVADQPLASIVANSPQLAAVRASPIPAGCQGCTFAQACAGGLRCMGGPIAQDPGCWRQPVGSPYRHSTSQP